MITIQFGKQLKKIRSKTNLSQEKFALKIDMDRSYYGKIENGKINVSLENIKKIADGFDLTIHELFGDL